MRFLFLIWMTLTASVASAYEETVRIPGSPEIRAALGPRDVVESYGYVTGQFILRVQIVSAHAFEALNFKMPDIANARVVTLTKPRTKPVETYVAKGFIFETALAIFPTKSGELVIPPLIADGAVQPEGQDRVAFHTETLEQRIEIRAAPVALPDNWWIVTPRVEMEETWSKSPADAHPGDIIRREVIARVYGVEAERLPPLVLTGSEGVVISDHGGERKTLLSTDGVIGKVSRSWDIRVDDPHLATIGSVGVTYWHQTDHQVQTVEAPARRLEPTPADPEAAAATLLAEAAEDRRVGRAAAFVLSGLIAFPALLLLAAFVWSALPNRADRTLRRALRSDQPHRAIFQAIEEWAMCTKVDLTQGPESFKQLKRSLFAEQGAAAMDSRLLSDLMSLSRNRRITSMKTNIYHWRDAVFGASSRLEH